MSNSERVESNTLFHVYRMDSNSICATVLNQLFCRLRLLTANRRKISALPNEKIDIAKTIMNFLMKQNLNETENIFPQYAGNEF